MPDVFQVLADPTRRRIVDALRDGERSVTELVAVVSIGQPGVSRQLQILEDADFLVVRPEGRRRIYSLRPNRFRELSGWVAVPDHLGEHARQAGRRARPAGEEENHGSRKVL